jgi:hypothetical protein
MLITRKVDDMQLGLYRTEFYAACTSGKTEVVKVLLQVGMRLNVDGEQINAKDSEDANNTNS